MSVENAKEYLKKFGLENNILRFEKSCATVKEAADTIGCKEEEIAKSISFIIDDKPILILASGTSKIDNSKYKQEFSTKARMIPYEEVESMIGHPARRCMSIWNKRRCNSLFRCFTKRFQNNISCMWGF